MPCASSSHEGFRWRPWPCDQCRQGITPIGHLFGCAEAGSGLAEATPEEIARRQASELIGWVQGCAHTGWEDFEFPRLAQGSEHAVYLNTDPAEVYKVTLPETYGEYYYLVDGIVNQEKCTPLQYLIRLHLWGKIFGSAPRAIGLTPRGQVVSRQEFITGTTPSQQESNDFLVESGCQAVKESCWLWSRPYESFEVWVGDARSDNFVKTVLGIVPIDLRVWLTSIGVG